MPRLSLSRPRRVETTVQVDNKGHTEKPRPGRSTRKAHRTRRSRSSHGLAHAEHALVQAIGLPRLSSQAETCRGYRRALVQVEERRGERPKSARSRRDTQMLSFRPTRPARGAGGSSATKRANSCANRGGPVCFRTEGRCCRCCRQACCRQMCNTCS